MGNSYAGKSAFYSVRSIPAGNPDLRGVTPPQEQAETPPLDLAALVDQLQKSPELAKTLAALLAGKKAS